ncbi:MAG: hypothetical protein KKD63_07420 [Proteobacteria bacterium]|nr:hypothetical protein [Desulfobulbaceae bacterium]MBU4152693.1 hypothetical protein [Pseudomonadota bacterium]MDP2106017.1 hypothetical protein [Desulfobulbaceae bacterium]
MNKNETTQTMSAEKKTAICIVMSMFYFAMLAYPFGVAMEGFVWQKAMIAGVIFFAISIPAWIVNLKREFYDHALVQDTVKDTNESFATTSSMNFNNIAQMAQRRNWLTAEEINQIRFCLEGEQDSTFDQVAIKRNYLSKQQVETLLATQSANV